MKIKNTKGKIIHFIKNLMVPSKQSGPLANYQRIIAIGTWILIICGVLSLALFFCIKKPSVFSLWNQYPAGIFCSMLVMLIASILEFHKTRDEMLGDFCNSVFLLTSMYKMTMDSKGVINYDEVEYYSEKIEEEKDKYDKVAFSFIWFSKKKADAHLEVVKNIFAITRKLNGVLEKKKNDTEGMKNKEIMEIVVENMIIISEDYYPDEINLFKNWMYL